MAVQSLQGFHCRTALNPLDLNLLISIPISSPVSNAKCKPCLAHPNTTMAVPEVDKKMLEELAAMGFPRARATRALHYSGNASLEAAIDWIVDHENDADIDEMPWVTVDISLGSPEPFYITEGMKIKAQELRDRACKKKEEERKLERVREKERIQSGKQLIEAKRSFEENKRNSNIEFWKAEKEEEKRARERIRWKLEQDKLERRVKLGLAPGQLAAEKRSTPAVRIEQDDDARVRRAFQTLLIYVGNVTRSPNEEKFRKIRLSNPLFLDRVGSLTGGIVFLELCGLLKRESFCIFLTIRLTWQH